MSQGKNVHPRPVGAIFLDYEQHAIGDPAAGSSMQYLPNLLPETRHFRYDSAMRHEAERGDGVKQRVFPFVRDFLSCQFHEAGMSRVNVR